MADRWIVFGGWGVKPEILRPLFGNNPVLVDSTAIASSLVRDATLVPDWQEILAAQFRQLQPGTPLGIAGWSTGAIMAWALAKTVEPACVVCLSATPSFCQRPGFSPGRHPSMLRAMRRGLARRPNAVLSDFYQECGMNGETDAHWAADLPTSSLTAGLHFLEQAALFPLEKPDFKALFLHGRQDAIIPTSAGRYFSEQTKGTFEEYDGPHAFFITQSDALRQRIGQFSLDCL
jgi:pimeloyl-ACP methyl ester carboxylesterase